MRIITITLNNKNFQLACEDEEDTTLQALAVQLNDKITEVKNSNPFASFELAVVIAALGLQEQLNSLENRLNNGAYGETIRDEKIAESLGAIAEYLERLAQKITK